MSSVPSSTRRSRAVRWSTPASKAETIQSLTAALNSAVLSARMDPNLLNGQNDDGSVFCKDWVTRTLFNWEGYATQSGRKFMKTQKRIPAFVDSWVSKAVEILDAEGVPSDEACGILDSATTSAECVPNGVQLTISSTHPALQHSEDFQQSIVVPPVIFPSDDLIQRYASSAEILDIDNAADRLAIEGVNHLRSAGAAEDLSALVNLSQGGETNTTVTKPSSSFDLDAVTKATEPYFRAFVRESLITANLEREETLRSGQGSYYRLSLGRDLSEGSGQRRSTKGSASVTGKHPTTARYQVKSGDGFFFGLRRPQSATLEEILAFEPVEGTSETLPFSRKLESD